MSQQGCETRALAKHMLTEVLTRACQQVCCGWYRRLANYSVVFHVLSFSLSLSHRFSFLLPLASPHPLPLRIAQDWQNPIFGTVSELVSVFVCVCLSVCVRASARVGLCVRWMSAGPASRPVTFHI